ncbi:hypothetical protein ACKKBG_A02945 [Auxenochlorella protothecoides x Auxenochlorella symbiontica]|uniref:Prefoldin subunit 1 n=1 Tax=Auxenochlorella protothecoides TaxID=3075 RepID=A0A087SM64_AUXPR|nr:hypothetical protein F751_0750 [Auxenochlorella protothecoides]KFM26818.1 hypothetical protein F751_0750 [Auxenochlorella protothecoides]RMZ55727.1 hypothetical protein APUTEX25_005768 [Auxenochlorella protothecoides]|eukprot:RMZ55727.1 hypothetical protein APUTEX25_005768 [Auxenochlorella protothecoides]
MADDDKIKAIRELKSRFDHNNSALKQMESQRRQNEVTLRRAAFTAAQLDGLPSDTPCYRGVGRAYFLQPKESVMTYLETGIKSCDTDLKRLTSSRDALVKSQEELRKEITELISVRS